MRKEQEHLIGIKEMCGLIGRDRRTLWAWVRSGKFPAPLRINGRTIGWRASSYRTWLENAR